MKQQTLAMAADQNAGFEQFRKPTRRDEFLNMMNVITPCAEMALVIEPFYPKGVGGRPPIGLQRIHFIKHWFNLADLACEERCIRYVQQMPKVRSYIVACRPVLAGSLPGVWRDPCKAFGLAGEQPAFASLRPAGGDV